MKEEENAHTVPSAGGSTNEVGGTMYLFVAGDRSGVGKSTVCMGLLGSFMAAGYPPSSLAYIKPCTQCEDVQLISKYCESHGIAHRGLGPVRFYQGFTAECINDPHPEQSIQQRHQQILDAVEQISNATGERKKIVLVDGVGYPAVGSVSGVSNAAIAKLLGAPVLLVGRPGVGNAIDSFDLNATYFHYHHVHVLGGVWNNMPEKESYHTYQDCVESISRHFARHSPGLGLYGFVRRLERQWEWKVEKEEAVACILRETKGQLAWEGGEEDLAREIVENQMKYLKGEDIIRDLKVFYKSKQSL